MLRAANTGISAEIDTSGRVTAALELNMAGYLDALLPAPAAPTVYSRTGDTPWAILLFLGLVAAVLTRARLRQSAGIDAGKSDA